MNVSLVPQPLTAEAFERFGDVIAAGTHADLINRGTTQLFADLADIDVSAGGGRPRVSLYRTRPYAWPLRIAMLERHPLGSQLFMPLEPAPFLVVVAAPGSAPGPTGVQAFMTNGRQGVNYRRGTWHHPLIAVGNVGDFLVLDRAGTGSNCDEFWFEGDEILIETIGS